MTFNEVPLPLTGAGDPPEGFRRSVRTKGGAEPAEPDEKEAKPTVLKASKVS